MIMIMIYDRSYLSSFNEQFEFIISHREINHHSQVTRHFFFSYQTPIFIHSLQSRHYSDLTLHSSHFTLFVANLHCGLFHFCWWKIVSTTIRFPFYLLLLLLLLLYSLHLNPNWPIIYLPNPSYSSPNRHSNPSMLRSTTLGEALFWLWPAAAARVTASSVTWTLTRRWRWNRRRVSFWAVSCRTIANCFTSLSRKNWVYCLMIVMLRFLAWRLVKLLMRPYFTGLRLNYFDFTFFFCWVLSTLSVNYEVFVWWCLIFLTFRR